MKRNWDLRSAVNVINGEVDQDRKVIYLRGNETLTSSGAIDYLKKVHGYKVI